MLTLFILKSHFIYSQVSLEYLRHLVFVFFSFELFECTMFIKKTKKDNENIENFKKKTIADTNNQLKKKIVNENLNQQWITVNKALQLAEENQQKL